MFEMTTLEKVYKYFYEENLNPNDMSKSNLYTILERFDAQEFETNFIQSLSKADNIHSEQLFIKSEADAAVVRRPRYLPQHGMYKHNFIEFTYVYNGLCKFIQSNEKEITLKEGNLLQMIALSFILW
ncbi:hypothetical protein [Clostridium magnum]|uniref:Uncharacterized protein n=1 Tax=Clostridium magnum DSM 2767 TaxID=1121326 RepID=A0A162R111_9CLOT|nr:hypothetical protein [Clostridium magnum]KZL89261.1 hypothetical protein CLMAG_54790 [Clostridium magnum DSM 2767]SHI97110.1 hypothetical protein SAMN02745944_05155 [Clostridium magnum DSM 2767]